MILVSKLKSDLRSWIHVNIPEQVIDNLQDSDFYAIWNYVARDINDMAKLRIEKFKQQANSSNAEDSNLTNYLLQGVIRDIFQVYFWDYNASNQYYSYTADRFILKVAPTEGTEIEITYLRDTEDVTEDSSEVDLPDQAYFIFLDLVKEKMKADFLSGDNSLYQVKLNAVQQQLRITTGSPILKGEVQSTWFDQTGDNRYYDITDKFVGIENFIAGVDGNYTHVDA